MMMQGGGVVASSSLQPQPQQQQQEPSAAAAMAANKQPHQPQPQQNQQSSKRLEGKVAIVTGGARGIGEAIVRAFVQHGALVVIADIDDAAGRALAAALHVDYEHCDVSVEADVERTVRVAVARHGRLDVLCNNAGVLGRQSATRRSIMSLDAGEFERVLRVNALGAALGMKHAAAAMLPRRQGSIVSVASVAGVMGGMGPHAYTASKHALVGLTKNAACELGAHGIRVNCISPFGVATTMLRNAWRGCGHGDACSSCSSSDDSDSDAMEELVATLKGPTLRAADVAEAALFLAKWPATTPATSPATTSSSTAASQPQGTSSASNNLM